MQLNQDIVLIITIAITLALAGSFILSMYAVTLVKRKLEKDISIELDVKVVSTTEPTQEEMELAEVPKDLEEVPQYELVLKQGLVQQDNSSATIDMTKGGVFDNGQEEIINIVVQNEFEKLVEAPELFESALITQPDLTEIGKDWEKFDVIDRIGCFEIYSPTADSFKWRFNEEAGVALKSNANYMTEKTCKNGLLSVSSRIHKKSSNPPLVITFTKDFGYRILIKAVNGKHLGYGEYFENEELAIYALDKAAKVLKNNILLPQ